MNVFISEYVCSGAWPHDAVETSLFREGRAMLLAFLDDLAKTAGCQTITTWDRRLGSFPLDQVQAFPIASNTEERRLFLKLAAASDATLVIAPESDNILLERRRQLEKFPCRCLGSTADAIRLCSNKLLLASHLQLNDVPTITTLACDPQLQHPAIKLPLVLKPRDGAGSQLTFLIDGNKDFQTACDEFRSSAVPAIQQPFLRGWNASVGTLIHGVDRIETFPAGEQHLSNDGRFHYLGGVIPGRFTSDLQSQIETTVRRACDCIQGLRGFVGFDLILPEKTPDMPVIVDINPRLTTSYLGYRLLTDDNLATRSLQTEADWTNIEWKNKKVIFSADGSYKSGQSSVSFS